jgi:glycosyltransferase involved in cell wall biosynthesis
VPEGTARPLWSVMIPTYNCATYLRETLASVLAQDPGRDDMHIEVVDDHSTVDDPEAVVAELGRGRVEFFRQPRNVGHVANFNTCLRRSRGRLVHLLHGDDLVSPGFYARMGRLFERHPDIGAAFCRHTVVDEHGNVLRISPLERPDSGVLQQWLERIASELPLQPPSIAAQREVYERLGGFDRRMLSCGEDWEMWVRISAHYPVAYEPEPLAVYRDNPSSLTKRSVRSGQNIRDVRQATHIVRSYLPRPLARIAARRASESWATWALWWAERLIASGDMAAAVAQIREGLRCSHSRPIMRRALPLTVRIAKDWLRGAGSR